MYLRSQAVLLLTCVVAQCDAAIVNLEFVGSITESVHADVSVGAPYSLVVSYDDAALPDADYGDVTFYSIDANFLLDYNDGELTYQASSYVAQIQNNYNGNDSIQLTSQPTGAFLSNVDQTNYIGIYLYDSSETSLESTQLPNMVSLDTYDNYGFEIGFKDGGGSHVIRGNITSIVPEPASYALLFGGVALLATYRRKNRIV